MEVLLTVRNINHSIRISIEFDLIVAFDLERMADSAFENLLFDAAVKFLEELVKKSEDEINSGILKMDNLFNHKVDLQKYRMHLNTTKKVHDDWLDKRGQYGIKRRCNKYPFDSRLRKKKKFRKNHNAPVINSRKEIERYATLKGQADRNVEYQIATQLQVDKLCRGSQLRVITKFDIIL